MIPSSRRFLASLLFGVLLAHTPSLLAAPVDELKAAYLLNFAKLTTWPADQFRTASDAVVFCGLANDPVMEAMRALGERRVDNRIVRIRTLNHFGDNAGCHVLYTGAHSLSSSKKAADLRRRGLLLVGEAENFLEQGGIIGYFLQQGKLRFEISADNARAVDLVLSARLLNLARRREGEP